MENIRRNPRLYADFWIEKMQQPERKILEADKIPQVNREIFYRCLEEGCMFDIADMQNVYGWGICTRRGNIKKRPADGKMCSVDEEDQLAAILVNEPVVIVKASQNRRWYYIYTYYYGGWVKAENIALCKDYDSWLAVWKKENPLVVTGSRIRLECNPYNRQLSRLELSMATVLELDTGTDMKELLTERNYCCAYVAHIPVRDSNGLLMYQKGQIPFSCDVHIGFLDYTAENVIRQAFKTLGEIYGWGGGLNSRDCSSLVSDVFACFGIWLPRDTAGLQTLFGLDIYMDISSLSIEEKKKMLGSIRPGAVLGFPGHVMLYLGEDEGSFYVINQVGHFCLEKEEKLITYQVDSCIVNDLGVLRKNGRSWLESLTYVLFYDF